MPQNNMQHFMSTYKSARVVVKLLPEIRIEHEGRSECLLIEPYASRWDSRTETGHPHLPKLAENYMRISKVMR
jgi:hypothetical protein